MSGQPPVGDHRPPAALRRVLNPALRALLSGPTGRLLGRVPLVVVEFRGRRSARPYRIVVGWHLVDGDRALFSPAPWRHNFAGGAPVDIVHGGRRLSGTATLVEDPETVADALQQAIDHGSTPSLLGLRVAPGHRITPDDVRATGRALIRLDL